jgi:hypothetical protein
MASIRGVGRGNRAFRGVPFRGSKARLALALYTGQRRLYDSLKLGMYGQGERDRLPPAVLLLRKMNPFAPHMLPSKKQYVGPAPSGALTFLLTEFGCPFSANGFSNRFRKWCDEAGLRRRIVTYFLFRLTSTRQQR